MRKSLIVLSSVTLVAIIAVRCKNNGGGSDDKTVVKPVPLFVDSSIAGFHFPENADTIAKWTNNPAFPGSYDSVSIYNHAWGIWAGLTAKTNQVYGGDSLCVYETWMGLNEVYDQIKAGHTDGGCQGAERVGRAMLTRPKQFEHAAHFSAINAPKLIAQGKLSAAQKTAPPPTFTEGNAGFWVTVSYSPDAACYATKNAIFKQSVINNYYSPTGLGAIPTFPNTSITIKPTYMVFKDTAALMKLPAWITAPNPADSNFWAFAQMCVYIDKKNGGHKKPTPITVGCTNPDSIALATCNLEDFIHFRVDQRMASFMNQQDSVQGMNNSSNPSAYGKAVKGQIAVLVAMHVTTKEVSNWTWQTYYWASDPDNPGSPSSVLAGKLRQNAHLKGAANHYAANAAYVMTTPNNAANGASTGSMFGYNPYLEGGFGPTTFGITNNLNPQYQYGVQTNCMSCHAMAVASSHGQYTTDQFVNLTTDSLFKGEVSLDFAWSIQTGIIADTVPYWKFANYPNAAPAPAPSPTPVDSSKGKGKK